MYILVSACSCQIYHKRNLHPRVNLTPRIFLKIFRSPTTLYYSFGAAFFKYPIDEIFFANTTLLSVGHLFKQLFNECHF
jgi:hypothetical protein